MAHDPKAKHNHYDNKGSQKRGEEDKRGPAKNTCGSRKFKMGKEDRSTRARAGSVIDLSETTSSSSVAEIGILRLRLSWGLDARGCRLLRRRGVVP